MKVRLRFLLMLFLGSELALAQSGKITGQVTDAATGDPLPGVNVVIDGTVQGATTDVDGYYLMLNIKPGTYTLKATFVGYTAQLVENVRVNIDQTTRINFALQEAVVGLDELVVVAERPVVQADVSNSQANISAADIEALPVSTISGVVGLQAGVQGLSVRGSGSDQLSFQVNGLTLRDERDNSPFTNISLTSVSEVQVLTGGFNAEYGNVRSGVINVVTKEGGRDRYEVDVITRYSPPGQKRFGAGPNDPNSYWIRPYLDPAVAWTGTENGAWDRATREQYPSFQGWIRESEELLEDDDPANDLTPEALQQAFLWQHRKVVEITRPDYNVDVGLGGPVPLLNRFGGTRFFLSYRQDENQYIIPLHTEGVRDRSGHVKLTSDIARGMKLSAEALFGHTFGTASSRSGQPGVFRSAGGIAGEMSRVSFIDTRIFSTDYWTPTTIRTNMQGLTFTHAPSTVSFYEIRLNRFASDYDTNPGRLRDETPVVFFGGVGFDEAPFGFQPEPTFGVDGMRTGVGMSNARDTSQVVVWNLKADLTSQVNRVLQVKTGIEYNLTDTRVNYGQFDEFLPASNSRSQWDETPVRGAAYGQGKLEFQGMIANLGLRLDYFHAGGRWYVYDPFTDAFSARLSGGIDTLLVQEPTDRIVTLSPRLGVSFPVTSFSKLFFNYGHFRSLPDPNNLYLLRFFTESGQVQRVADPNNPLPRTIAYELGYEHSLRQQFLVRVAGYYKNVDQQPFLVNYVSRNGESNYIVSEPNSYEDIRGFEFTFERIRGRWVQGFFNYTYMVSSFGYFGFDTVFENKTQQRALENDDAARRAALSKPVPRPFARLNLDLLTPLDFGPAIGTFRPLGDWRLSFIGAWSDGGKFTWADGGSKPGVLNNVDGTDNWNLDLRFAKTFTLNGRQAQFFIDVFNATNRRALSFNGFVDGVDQRKYLESLHFPASPDYSNIPGDDRVGDYRKAGVAFVPLIKMQNRASFNGTPEPGSLYYEADTQTYLQYAGDTWQAAGADRVQQVLDDKAYIDMPNQGFLTFLNPRDVFFGFRLSF